MKLYFAVSLPLKTLQSHEVNDMEHLNNLVQIFLMALHSSTMSMFI